MAAPRPKRSPAGALDSPNTELVQVRISEGAHELLEARARAEALTVAGYLRRVIYRDIGLLDRV